MVDDVTIDEVRGSFSSGQEMWDWVLYGNPIPGMLVADPSEEQQATLRHVLDGMLRERAGPDGRATLTNRVKHRDRHEVKRRGAARTRGA
jgi:hypothetical protein